MNYPFVGNLNFMENEDMVPDVSSGLCGMWAFPGLAPVSCGIVQGKG